MCAANRDTNTRPADDERLGLIAGPCESNLAEPLTPLIQAIHAHLGEAIVGVIFYGSCLRSGDIHDGLVDFYVVVDSYRRAHNGLVSAAANELVPPNVYYLEAGDDDASRLRCKYAVVSEAALARGCSTALLSSLWGRLSQPVAIVQARDDAARARLRACLGQAVITLLDECLPAIQTDPMVPADVFASALALSYGGELRAETSDRSGTLIASHRAEYARRLHAARERLSVTTELDAAGRLHWYPSAAQKRRALRRWQWRRPLGRAVSVARLTKACFTFRDAIDYGAWKLARHTGVEIPVTDRLRRHPILYGAPLLWRLYRRGVLR